MSQNRPSRYEANAAQHAAIKTLTAEKGFPVSGVGLTCTDQGWAVSVSLTEPASTEMPEQIKGVPIIYKVVRAPVVAQC